MGDSKGAARGGGDDFFVRGGGGVGDGELREPVYSRKESGG